MSEVNKINLISYLEISCHGLNATAQEIINGLLNENNIEDVLSGDIPIATLKAHVRAWVDSGKRRINVDKGS